MLKRILPTETVALIIGTAIILAIVMAFLWLFSVHSVITGLGFSIVFIVAVAQPIGYFWRGKEQTYEANKRLGFAIFGISLVLSVPLFLWHHSIGEVISFLVLPALLLWQSIAVVPDKKEDVLLDF